MLAFGLAISCFGASKLQAQQMKFSSPENFKSREQFISTVKLVYNEFPRAPGDSVLRASIIKAFIINPTLNIPDMCTAQNIEAWRGTLNTALPALSVNSNQLSAYLQGIDQALAVEVRKGQGGPCAPSIPLRAAPPIAGPTGPQGERGPQGIQGPAGRDGKDYTPPKEKKSFCSRYHCETVGIVAGLIGGGYALSELMHNNHAPVQETNVNQTQNAGLSIRIPVGH
jgi:hypothetical protein